jgi:hypothetical protein
MLSSLLASTALPQLLPLLLALLLLAYDPTPCLCYLGYFLCSSLDLLLHWLLALLLATRPASLSLLCCSLFSFLLLCCWLRYFLCYSLLLLYSSYSLCSWLGYFLRYLLQLLYSNSFLCSWLCSYWPMILLPASATSDTFSAPRHLLLHWLLALLLATRLLLSPCSAARSSPF